MQSLLIALLFATTAAHGQDVIETANGSYRAVQDKDGRYVRLESANTVVNYLYDSPSAQAESGVVIDLANGPTLTVHYDTQGNFWAPGMAKVKILRGPDERTTEILADNEPIATFDYRLDKYISAVTIPDHFTIRVTPPDRRKRVRQTLLNADGAVVRQTEVVSSSSGVGIWRGMSFEPVTQALGFDARSLSFEQSADGYLQTGRDGAGRVALYIVNAGANSVGFTPDGVARFYDITADILDSDIAPGGDAGVSLTLEQSKAVPAHVTLTAGGMPGVYIEEPANGAIYAAWVERNGRDAAVHHAISSRVP